MAMPATDTVDLPNDIDLLKKIISDHRAEIMSLNGKLLWSEEKYRALELKYFGRKSEQYSKEDDIQGRLFDEAEAYSTDKETPEVDKSSDPAQGKPKRGRKTKEVDLPSTEVIHELPNEEQNCPCCGKKRPVIGDKRTSETHLVPAHAETIVHVMKTYGPCDCDAFRASEEKPVVCAPGPEKIVKGSDFSNKTIAFFLTAKYADAIPFYRMEKMLKRSGLHVSRAGLCNLAISVGRATGDLVEAMNRDLASSPVMLMDETTLQVLKSGAGPPGKSYMWVTCGFHLGKPIQRFAYHSNRSGSFADSLLGGFSGYLQTDGYSGYDHLDESAGIVHVGCFAHMRRKFVEAWEVAGKTGIAKEAINVIARIYKVESDLRKVLAEGIMDQKSFVTTRAEMLKPVFSELRDWLMAKALDVAPQSKLGRAISYAQGVFERCIRFVEHPLLTPDTNPVENAIRPFVVGRKNWLFSGSPKGAHASAGLYSLIETAKANGHEPYAYLCYLFDELPKCKTTEEKESLLPYRLEPAVYAGTGRN
jgi:transposase